MFEQDYLMRLIKEMVRAIFKLLFKVDTEQVTEDLIDNKEDSDMLNYLTDMVDAGQINDAENKLFDRLDKNDTGSLQIALLFYSHLNDKTNEFLEENNFSREEIKSGISNVADMFGISSVAKMFLTDI